MHVVLNLLERTAKAAVSGFLPRTVFLD